jgi:hypothetical protein
LLNRSHTVLAWQDAIATSLDQWGGGGRGSSAERLVNLNVALKTPNDFWRISAVIISPIEFRESAARFLPSTACNSKSVRLIGDEPAGQSSDPTRRVDKSFAST